MRSSLARLEIWLLCTIAVSAHLQDAIKQPQPLRILHPAKRSPGVSKVGLNPLVKRQECQIFNYCQGTCEECFGSGFTNCPGDSVTCYKPGDACYDIDTCDSSSGSSSAAYSSAYATTSATPTFSSSASYIASASYSSYDAYYTNTDYCSGSCVTCWGAGYIECPNDSDYCYDPSNSTSVCPGGNSGSSSSGSSADDGSCAETYGAGNVPCGDGCYNPSGGEDCCSNGHYCSAGTVCSSTVGECEYADSFSSSLASYGGYVSSAYSSSSSSSYSYDSYTTSSTHNSFAALTTIEESTAGPTSSESTSSSSSVPVSGSGDSTGVASIAPSQASLVTLGLSVMGLLLGVVCVL